MLFYYIITISFLTWIYNDTITIPVGFPKEKVPLIHEPIKRDLYGDLVYLPIT